MKEKEIKSKFVKVKCPKCGNEQVIFGKASTIVKCTSCDRIIADPSGGKAKIKAQILEVINKL